mgnify:CR=1 FL=1
MPIEEIMSSGKLPKLYRAVKVELSVLRNEIVGGGIAFDQDSIESRKVRRVLCHEGWRWALVRECKNQEEWDYYFDEDKICLEDLNAELGLI